MTIKTKPVGLLILAILLILTGVAGLTGLAIPLLIPVLSLVAGVLILIGE